MMASGGGAKQQNTMKRPKHEIRTYPRARITTADIGRISLRKHHVAGLLEVDITDVRALLRRKQSGKGGVSLFAWIVKTVADVMAENRHIHAMAGRRSRVVIFDDVDISVVVERNVDGTRVPLPMLIRGADKRTVEDIYGEIRTAQGRQIENSGDYVLKGRSVSKLLLKLYYVVPRLIRLTALRYILNNPFQRKKVMGTAVITSVGFGRGLSGWIIPKSMHNVSIALGSVTKKPWVVKHKVLPRDILHLTVLLDHDVVDGVPAARFAAALANRLSSPDSG
jgi:pyruvate/2-oxoglutarate dehydrogenase complex dihydrolipoamide acyltransferase (E2) component